jgi:hypothetical protein
LGLVTRSKVYNGTPLKIRELCTNCSRLFSTSSKLSEFQGTPASEEAAWLISSF